MESVWSDEGNSMQFTFFTSVSLTQQVFIKGEAEKKNDLIALRGLYIDKGEHCKYKPPSAKQGKMCTVVSIELELLCASSG